MSSGTRRRKASLSTIESLLLHGCELTASGNQFKWILPDGTHAGSTNKLDDLPKAVDDYTSNLFPD